MTYHPLLWYLGRVVGHPQRMDTVAALLVVLIGLFVLVAGVHSGVELFALIGILIVAIGGNLLWHAARGGRHQPAGKSDTK
jgi:steroid 5-alpha reductase family enzyme